MRIIFCIFFFLTITAHGQSPYLAKALAEARSGDYRVRTDAMALLSRDDSPAAKEALIDLLNYEDRAIADANRRASQNPNAQDLDEEYAEYEGILNGIVMKIAEDPRYCRAIPVLVRSGPDPDTKAAKWLARHGEQIVPDVLELVKSDLDVDRYSGIGLSALLINYEDAGIVKLQPAHRLALKRIAATALNDPGPMTKQEAIIATAIIGDPSIIPELQRIAQEDTSYDYDRKLYPLRQAATVAIFEIGKRKSDLRPQPDDIERRVLGIN